MNLDEIVCHCLGVTNGMIKEAVENGATTVEDIAEATGAGTGCGGCVDEVQKLVDYFISET